MQTAEPYVTKGGVEPKPSYGLTTKYLFGVAGETGFGSKSTAEQVAAGWDGSGVVVLVTGAAAGLGYESARVLAARGAHVVVAVRSQARAEATAARLRADVAGATVTPLELDLSSLASVRQAAEAFKRTGLQLHILLLNAGIMACPWALSRDGFELQWATNHLGHFALTQRLRGVMVESARAAGRPGRVVVLSSMGHHLYEVPGGINFEALRSGESDYVPFNAYGVSKLSNILFARELQRRLTAEGAPIIAVACHPGVILETDLTRHMSGQAAKETTAGTGGGSGAQASSCRGTRRLKRWLSDASMALTVMAFKPLSKTVPQGAATQVLLATSPSVVPGEYYSDCNLASSSAASHNGELGARLWSVSEDAMRREEEAAGAAGRTGAGGRA